MFSPLRENGYTFTELKHMPISEIIFRWRLLLFKQEVEAAGNWFRQSYLPKLEEELKPKQVKRSDGSMHTPEIPEELQAVRLQERIELDLEELNN